MAAVGVRAAPAADVPVIAELHRTTWRAAYARLLPEGVLDALDGPAALQAWAEAVTGGATVIVASEGGADVGSRARSPAPDAGDRRAGPPRSIRFHVEDLDAALAGEPEQQPYGLSAECTDDQDARFWLLQS